MAAMRIVNKSARTTFSSHTESGVVIKEMLENE